MCEVHNKKSNKSKAIFDIFSSSVPRFEIVVILTHTYMYQRVFA